MYSQTTFDSLWHKAYNFLFIKKQADSALLHYQQIVQQFPNNKQAHTYLLMGNCYLALHDTTNAQLYYTKCLDIANYKPTGSMVEQDACFSLADIYCHNKDYKKALTYINNATTIYKPLVALCTMGTNGQEVLMRAYKKARCYNGINQKDSALIQLAPIIATMANDVFIDTLAYKSIVHFFANTIIEIHGMQQTKRNLNYAVKKTNYKTSYTEILGTIMCTTTCYITLSNIKINICDRRDDQVSKRGEIPSNYSKKILLDNFKKSYLYKCLNTSSTLPNTSI
jgi:tetratricopeptide (TPR) repeat protein